MANFNKKLRILENKAAMGFGSKGGFYSSSNKAFLPLIFAITAAALLSAGVIFIFKSQAQQKVEKKENVAAVVAKEPEVEMVGVLIPIREIKKGEPLTSSMFTKVMKPKILLPEHTITDFSQLRGKFAKINISPHTVMVNDFITSEKPVNFIVGNIPEGYRAITVRVNATSSVEGWARAGARVDIQWITDAGGQKVSKILVENAKILSADRKVDPSADPLEPIPTTVTLLVSEKDAQKIGLASVNGTMILHLRGFSDGGKAVSTSRTLTYSDLVRDKNGLIGDEHIQGFVTAEGPDGTQQQWALINGKLVSRTKR
ncbi:MAG: Flp pilus assembly protein CpaB [Candidatus Dadabacteria bacterium]|nr:MAG: Flp pilus assembly protein CpaB [Candidatus Dadabacteria bacterium]